MKLDPDDPLHFSWDAPDDTPTFIRSLGAVIHPDIIAASSEGVEGDERCRHWSSHLGSSGEVDDVSVQESQVAISVSVPST